MLTNFYFGDMQYNILQYRDNIVRVGVCGTSTVYVFYSFFYCLKISEDSLRPPPLKCIF